MKKIIKPALIFATSALFLTGCIEPSSEELEGEWRSTSSVATTGAETLLLDINDKKMSLTLTIDDPTSEEDVEAKIEFEYKINEKDGDTYTIEPSEYSATVSGGSLTDKEKENITNTILEDTEQNNGEVMDMRVEGDMLFWIYSNGDELELEKV
jgi:hypothetical protein